MVPARAATFCAPAYIDTISAHEEIYIAEKSFALFRKLKIQSLLDATGGRGASWNEAGLFEYLDFTNAGSLMQIQRREFQFTSDAEAKVNGLSTWIWCETSETGAPRARFPKTSVGFPFFILC